MAFLKKKIVYFQLNYGNIVLLGNLGEKKIANIFVILYFIILFSMRIYYYIWV